MLGKIFSSAQKKWLMGLSACALFVGASGMAQTDAFGRSSLNTGYASQSKNAPIGIATPVLHYQGRLLELNGTAKPDGAYSIQFALYTAETGGSAVWTETKNVQVVGGSGFFSTLLGEVTGLNLSSINGQALWLGVKVGADSELTPRQRLASVAYALYANTAGNAESLSGQTASAFAAAAHNHFGQTWSGTGQVGISVTNNSTVAYATGILGRASATLPGPYPSGIHGISDGSNGGIGVWGTQAGTGWGVYGESIGGVGVLGRSNSSVAVRGEGITGEGVDGISQGDGVAGVHGKNDGAFGFGVKGESTSGRGIYGLTSGTGYAGYFDGKVHINGTLSKSAGSFKIDHPLDPANKTLSHSFVESPDMLNVYNGNVMTNEKGEAVAELPNYFEALNRDFRYQLTVIGQFAQVMVAQEIENNKFVIRSDKPNVKVSWQVTGIRKDAYAQDHPIVVEEDKPLLERGTYLYPAGQPLGSP